MLSTLSGFFTSLAGKVVLGTAVTAASIGGLQATDVVDVPLLPDDDAPAVEEQAADTVDAAEAEAGAEGKATGEANHAAAQAYADARQEWTDCLAANAAAQGDETTRVTAGFDPRDGCGEEPRPSDFGLTDLPSQASDAAQDAVAGTPAGDGTTPGGASDVSIPSGPGNAPAAPPVPSDVGDSGNATATPPTTSVSVEPDSGESLDLGLFGVDDGNGGRP